MMLLSGARRTLHAYTHAALDSVLASVVYGVHTFGLRFAFEFEHVVQLTQLRKYTYIMIN